jgi:hypothetical protein
MSPAGAIQAGIMVLVADISQSFAESSPPLTGPLVLDKTFSVPQVGDGGAFVISNLLRMGADMETPMARNPDGSVFNLGSYGMEAKIDGNFSFNSVAAGMTIGVHFDADGTITLPAIDAEGDPVAAAAEVLASAAGGASGKTFDEVALSGGVAGTTPVHLTTDFSFVVDPNNLSPELAFDLRLSGGNGAALDFSHTAQVTFDLPPGVTVTSDGGFFQSGEPSSVPEPSSLALLAVGVVTAGLTAARRRRARQTANGCGEYSHRSAGGES